jgi:hypothetical protein
VYTTQQKLVDNIRKDAEYKQMRLRVWKETGTRTQQQTNHR